MRDLAKITGWKAEVSKQRLQFQNLETGRLVGSAADGPLVVQVLHAVHGLTPRELESSRRVTLSAGTLRIPSPPLLFKAKLANLRDIDQTDRHDLKHVMVLTHVLADYFDLVVGKCETGSAAERELVNEAGAVIRTLRGFRAVVATYRIPVEHIFSPVIRSSKLPKVQAFVRHQLAP